MISIAIKPMEQIVSVLTAHLPRLVYLLLSRADVIPTSVTRTTSPLQ